MENEKLLRCICAMSQELLLNTLPRILRKKYDEVVQNEKYIYAIGNIPVALVAHLDTVFSTGPINIFHDQEKDVYWSPEGLGADDRAGVFAILKIISLGLKPHIIFTTDEEKGGIGAKILSLQECPFEDLRFMIQLDRRGTNDCVFYDCANEEFTQFIEDFGFKMEIGSFSDISYLCPSWGIAGVNLSVGYYNEHDYNEFLIMKELLATIERVKSILNLENIPKFDYIKGNYYYDIYGQNFAYREPCDLCGEEHDIDDLEVVLLKDGRYIFCCDKCFCKNNFSICEQCGEAFQPTESKYNICSRCREAIYNG